MKVNVGRTDKTLRIILGLGLLGSFFFLEGSLKYASMVGAVFLFTGLFSFCPLYKILGLNTCKIK